MRAKPLERKGEGNALFLNPVLKRKKSRLNPFTE
jgi:hypothetical protein